VIVPAQFNHPDIRDHARRSAEEAETVAMLLLEATIDLAPEDVAALDRLLAEARRVERLAAALERLTKGRKFNES
jgi:hypothetical protein